MGLLYSKEPNFEKLFEGDGYEVRRYPSVVVAAAKVIPKSNIDESIQVLKPYFGAYGVHRKPLNNEMKTIKSQFMMVSYKFVKIYDYEDVPEDELEEEKKVAYSKGSIDFSYDCKPTAVSFCLPDEYTDAVGCPTASDKQIELKVLPSRLVAVMKYDVRKYSNYELFNKVKLLIRKLIAVDLYPKKPPENVLPTFEVVTYAYDNFNLGGLKEIWLDISEDCDGVKERFGVVVTVINDHLVEEHGKIGLL